MWFSIFIPVWNDTAWLPGAIESVLAQDHREWELVVGDNASDLDVASVVARYDDPRIRFHRFETHVRIDESFNRTSLLTRYPWVQLLCADDRLRPGCLTRLAAAIQEAERVLEAAGPGDGGSLALALTACRRVDPSGRPADRVWYGSKPRLLVREGIYDPASWFSLLLEDGQPPWNAGSIAVARTVIEESGGFFRPEVGLSCDVEMVLRAGAYGYVTYVAEPLLDFTVRSDADNAMRLLENRSQGRRETPVEAAIRAGLRVHEHRRTVNNRERRAAFRAIARSHLQRAGQHRVLPNGRGRRGAAFDVVKAVQSSPSIVLSPWSVAYALGAILLPARILHAIQRRLARRHPG